MLQEKIEEVITKSIANRVTPGANILVLQNGGEVLFQSLGRFTYDPNSPEVKRETVYDIASVTKIIVATAMLMLIDRGECSLEDPISKFLPGLIDSPVGSRTIWNLLTHTSNIDMGGIGIAEFVSKQEGVISMDEFIQAIREKGPAGAEVAYGNLNMLLMGEIIGRLSGVGLEQFLQTEVLDPLGMSNTKFNPNDPESIPPTEIVDGKTIQGVVHDEGARYFGGVVGHAGLFSTVDDLGRFVQLWLGDGTWEGKRLLSAAIMDMALTNQTPGLQSSMGLGWHLDSKAAIGEGLIAGTFSHTGFVGAMVAGNRELGLGWVLLANGTYPVRQEPEAKRREWREISRVLLKG